MARRSCCRNSNIGGNDARHARGLLSFATGRRPIGRTLHRANTGGSEMIEMRDNERYIVIAGLAKSIIYIMENAVIGDLELAECESDVARIAQIVGVMRAEIKANRETPFGCAPQK